MNFIEYNFGLKEAWDGLVGKKPEKKKNFLAEYLKTEQSNRAAVEQMLAANSGTKEGAKAYKQYLKNKDIDTKIDKGVKGANKILRQISPRKILGMGSTPLSRTLDKLHKYKIENNKSKKQAD